MILQMRKERLSADIDQVAFKKSKDKFNDVEGEHCPPNQVGGAKGRDQRSGQEEF